MITIKHRGSFNKTCQFLKKLSESEYLTILERYGQEGVNALKDATPIDSGITANSWNYEIRRWRNAKGGGATISWTNSNIVKGVPIAVILQYGHATSNGSFVQGRDYINPALQPIFDKIANDVWKEVTVQ